MSRLLAQTGHTFTSRDVRFEGESGRDVLVLSFLLMTQSRDGGNLRIRAYAVTVKTRLTPPRTFQQSTRLARPGFRYPSGPALGTYGHAQEVVAKLMPLLWPLDRRSHCASPATAVFLGASKLRGRRPMGSRLLATMFVVLASAGMADAQNAPKKPPTIINPPPTAQDYADLAKLPDWSGVWNPKITDQDDQARTNPPPWNEKVAKEVEKMWAEEKAGSSPARRSRSYSARYATPSARGAR